MWSMWRRRGDPAWHPTAIVVALEIGGRCVRCSLSLHLLTWLLVGGWLLMAVIAGGVASDKGRSVAGAVILTLFLGPIGLAIVLLLGANKPAAT